MTKYTNKFLLSLPQKSLDFIDRVIDDLNKEKESWHRPANRQAVIRGLVEFAEREDLEFSSRYTRHVWVKRKEKSKTSK